MSRTHWIAGVLGLSLATAALAAPSRALACGGCFAPTDSVQVVTDHRMVMAVHPTESVLWDQIRYSGRPEEFSWVLPVSGDVRVELGSEEFFDQLETMTAVRVQGPQVNTRCAGSAFGATPLRGAVDSDMAANEEGVIVRREEVVGPYQTVVLHSADSMALTDWLRAHNYAVPPALAPTIQYYTDRHMDFVAIRLRPGQGVAAMQPVRVRYATATMVLPLRMVAAGVGDKVGITLWVIARGRFEAQNFANGTIAAGDLVWDWGANRSNYRELFDARLEALGGRAWITEYSQLASSYYGSTPSNDPTMPTAADDFNLALNRTGLAATSDPPAALTITRMRTDLAAAYLDSDLVLQSATDNTQVSNQLRATREVGARPEPRCPSSGSLSFGGGAGIRCSARPPGRSSSTPGRKVLVFGVLAGALALTVSRRRTQR